MKLRQWMPLGAALLAMGLGLSSAALSVSRADDEDTKGGTEKKVIRITRDGEERDAQAGYLGVQVQRLTAALRRAKGIPESTEGTLVNAVEDGSPADNGGVRRGDVILEVNHEATPDPSDLVQLVRDLEPGSKVPVLIWRDGVRKTLNLKVGSRPEGNDAPTPPMPMPGWEGPGGDRGGPDGGPRMQMFRRNQGDLERQLRDIQEQLSKLRDEDLARLEREIHDLRSDLQRGGILDNNRDRNRSDDRGRDDNDSGD
ncbi:MAG TPA: PDZ domain-containing protein [Candidatus Eisenbacteria bacterium]|jgi:hypothetical protein